MPLSFILSQVGKKVGLNPADTNQRSVLLRFVNEAATELYQQSDMSGCLEEQYFKINANQTISLPDYVGQVRAMREADTQIAYSLSQMRPRYNEFNWTDGWRNYRVKGLHPLQSPILNQSVVTLIVKAVENPPITVQISGPVIGSSIATETIVMDATTKTSVNAYLDITAFTKTAVSIYDVTMFDVDGNQLSVIANNKLQAKFQILDISACPWIPPQSSGLLGWMEVLYKKALIWFQNDTDEFPAPGYDNVIVNKCLQLWAEEKGDIQGAIAYQQKATQSLAQIHEDANRGTDDVVSMCAHPHDQMNNRVGFGRDWKYAYRITGR